MPRFAPLLIACLLVAGCGGSSSPTTTNLAARTPPNLTAFLRLPIATPSSCPATVNGTTVGRSSPWVGHVDVSVFVSTAATTRQILKLGNTLRGEPQVQTVYFESSHQAHEEFQRLYTCSNSVAESQTPASYRLVLSHLATFNSRNALVARALRLPDVDTVSCDPSVPCVNVLQSATASPTPASGTMR